MAASGEAPNVGFIVNALAYAYLVGVLLGVPAYLLTSGTNLRPPYGRTLVGALIGLLPAGLLSQITTHVWFLVEIVAASSIGGLVFGLIAGRNLTHAWSGRNA
jgi:hypothetical protein